MHEIKLTTRNNSNIPRVYIDGQELICNTATVIVKDGQTKVVLDLPSEATILLPSGDIAVKIDNKLYKLSDTQITKDDLEFTD